MKSRFLDDAVLDDRAVKPLKMVCECRLDITWYRFPNTEWTDALARARIDEATRWFNAYCIHLDFEQFSLDATKPAEKKIQDELDALNAEYKARVARILRGKAAPQNQMNDIQSTVISIYDQLVKKAGAGRLIVLFLDEWYVKVGATANPAHWRTYRISANDGLRLLVGIDRYDTGSRHILTHELIHALRKAGANNNRNEFNAFVAANNVANINARAWQEHYGGKNQDDAMSFTNRAMAFRPFAKDTTDVFTVREYLTLLHAGLVKAAPGCMCDERKRRDKERL
ncbi:MAG: hypothetical protein WC213_03610 [Arenimonas sp.]|jgi:hypothetical protein